MLTARGEEADRIVGSSSAPTTTSRSRSRPRARRPRADRATPRASAGSDGRAAGVRRAEIDASTREVRRRRTSEADREGVRPALVPGFSSRAGCSHATSSWPRLGVRGRGRHRTVTVHVRRLREKIEDDPSRPRRPRDRLGRRLPVRARDRPRPRRRLATLAVGAGVAALLRLLPTVRLQLAGLALVAVLLPLGAVLCGWVMFHMGDDVKILAVAAASAVGGRRALILARSIAERLRRRREPRDGSPTATLGSRTRRRPRGGRRGRANCERDGGEPRAPLRRPP